MRVISQAGERFRRQRAEGASQGVKNEFSIKKNRRQKMPPEGRRNFLKGD